MTVDLAMGIGNRSYQRAPKVSGTDLVLNSAQA